MCFKKHQDLESFRSLILNVSGVPDELIKAVLGFSEHFRFTPASTRGPVISCGSAVVKGNIAISRQIISNAVKSQKIGAGW